MTGFDDFLIKNISDGRINEIIDVSENFFHKKAGDLPPEIKANILNRGPLQRETPISAKNFTTFLMSSLTQNVLMPFGVLTSLTFGRKTDLYTLIALWTYLPEKSSHGHFLTRWKYPQLLKLLINQRPIEKSIPL